MDDDEFLHASRADFETLLSTGDGRIPVPPEYQDAVAEALLGLRSHALLVRDALSLAAP